MFASLDARSCESLVAPQQSMHVDVLWACKAELANVREYFIYARIRRNFAPLALTLQTTTSASMTLTDIWLATLQDSPVG